MKRKNPIAASLLSALVFAGTGQIYNKQYRKGAFLLILYGALLILSFKPMMLGYLDYLEKASNVETMDLSKLQSQSLPKPNLLFTILMVIVWLYSILDAYISAKSKNGPDQRETA